MINKLARAEWLIEYGRLEEDVMVDEEDGKEYIVTDPTEGEMEDGHMTEFPGKAVYLPDFEEMVVEAQRLAQGK